MYLIKMSIKSIFLLLFSIELVINQNLDYKLPKLFEYNNLIDSGALATSAIPQSTALPVSKFETTFAITSEATSAVKTPNTSTLSISATSTTKTSNTSTVLSNEIIIDKKGNKCNDYNYSCELCLAKGCIYCWFEKECISQNHENENYKNDKKLNQIDNILIEKDTRIINNTIKSLGTINKNTCSKLNTLSNISASSCSINELTLLWIIFSTVILSISLLFGLLFYFCVFKSKIRDIIIIESDKDNFILIDED